MHLNPLVRTNSQGETVVLGNEENGVWLRVSKECYDLLSQAVGKDVDIDTVISGLCDEDKLYFRKLLEILKQSRIVLNEGDYPEQRLSQVTISITNRCNLKCIHCCIEADRANEEYYSDQDLFSVVDKVISCNPDSIVNSGGEPLLRNL